MFAQAMSSTMPVTASRKIIGMRASPCTWLCPRRPSSTPTSPSREPAIVCSLIPVWSGASMSLMIGRYTALMPARACSRETPGFSRAKRYAQ
jgi:hypothetical protein